MTRRLSVIASAFFALWVGIFAAGCLGPSIPIPPPNAIVAAPDALGIVTVTGSGLADAYVLCLNEDTEKGVIVRADSHGDFSLQITGAAGQTLSIWQEIGTDLGSPRTFIIPNH